MNIRHRSTKVHVVTVRVKHCFNTDETLFQYV